MMKNKLIKCIGIIAFASIVFCFNKTFAIDELPQRYNLAEHYNIKVENQGEEGNCWAFASLETLETYLQIHGYGTFDFSENHLNYIESNLFSKTDSTRDINTGSSYSTFREYVDKRFGPVLEEDFPYYEDEATKKHKTYTQDELDSLLDIDPCAYVGGFIRFQSITKNEKDDVLTDAELTEYRNKIKTHIIENGAISASIIAPSYFKNEFYNPETYAAYFGITGDERFTDHAHLVAIIGWDDNFSKENFCEANRPAHDGAYIILNSWGTSFGDGGLYYLSYDDAYVELELNGITEAALESSKLANTTTFIVKDLNLYNALKSILGEKINNYNDSEQSITMITGILNEITFLDLIDYNITDLSGIENFVNLSVLNLSHNNISDIHPLLGLHNLDTINLSNNKITHIPAELYNLTLGQLNLNYNNITDFSGIANIKSIAYLDLEGTNIKEADLKYLKNLKILNLNLSKTQIKDYSLLNSLNDEIIDDIRDMNLNNLNISYNEDIDYTTIPNVFVLNLSHTSVTEDKYNQIPDLSKLTSLDISYTNIKDMNIFAGKHMRAVYISGNRNLKNFDTLKNVNFITYNDAGLNDVSIFSGFTSSQLNLESNEIETYEPLLNNEFLSFINLSNNKISQTFWSESISILIDGNKVKPTAFPLGNIDSMKNQKYEETLLVDPDKENVFMDIVAELNDLRNAGIKFTISNANMNYETNVIEIDNYDKDVVITIKNGFAEGSTITYKLKKQPAPDISYIYIDRSKLKMKYIEGEEFSSKELKVYAFYNATSRKEITDYEIIGADNLQIGYNNITIKKDKFTDVISIEVIPKEEVATLTFNTKEIYEAGLKAIKKLENERRDYAYLYDHLDILISNDDETKTINIYKSDLIYISFLGIESNELNSIDDIKQFTSLMGLLIDGANFNDLSPLMQHRENMIETSNLLEDEILFGLEIKNNEKITKIDYDIFRTLVLENTKISDLNNLKKLIMLDYKGNHLPEINDILNSLQNIFISVSENIEDVQKDENNNIILPDLIKKFKSLGMEVEATICDQIRDEQYLYPFNKKAITILDKDDKLVLSYEDIKNVNYEGEKQFIEITIKDSTHKYSDFSFKYDLKYRLFKELELEEDSIIEVEEDTIPDLSNLIVYKVYSNGKKEQTKDFTYNNECVTINTKQIIISYSEDGVTYKLSVPIKVTEHIHEWGEWEIIKNATETEEGQRERICLKNSNHKEVSKIDKLPNQDTDKNEKNNQLDNIVPETNTDTNTNTTNPHTNDTGIGSWIGLMIISLFGMIITIIYIKSRRD